MLAIDAPDSLSLPVWPESVCSAFVVGLRYSCMVSADHPEIGEELTREQFLRLPLIIVRHFGRPSLLEESVQERFEAQLELPYLVQGTPFLAVTMEPLARHIRQSKTVRVMEIPEGAMPTSRLNMMWHHSFQADPGHAWMCGIILNECAGRPVGSDAEDGWGLFVPTKYPSLTTLAC